MKRIFKEYVSENSFNLLCLNETLQSVILKQNIEIVAVKRLFNPNKIKQSTYEDAMQYYRSSFLVKINNFYYYSIFRFSVDYAVIKIML